MVDKSLNVTFLTKTPYFYFNKMSHSIGICHIDGRFPYAIGLFDSWSRPIFSIEINSLEGKDCYDLFYIYRSLCSHRVVW